MVTVLERIKDYSKYMTQCNSGTKKANILECINSSAVAKSWKVTVLCPNLGATL